MTIDEWELPPQCCNALSEVGLRCGGGGGMPTARSIKDTITLWLLAVAITSLSGCVSENESRGTFTSSASPGHPMEAVSGERHCNRTSVTYLRIGGLQYARDPEGIIPEEWLLGSYEGATDLPADAIYSGYTAKDGDQTIWFASNRESIFVAGEPGATEEWPQVVTGFGCD